MSKDLSEFEVERSQDLGLDAYTSRRIDKKIEQTRRDFDDFKMNLAEEDLKLFAGWLKYRFSKYSLLLFKRFIVFLLLLILNFQNSRIPRGYAEGLRSGRENLDWA